MRAVLNFIGDWRNMATFLASVLVGLLVFLMIDSTTARRESSEAAQQRGAAATRRIDLLNKQLQQLQREIAAGRDERGRLAATVQALAEQVRRMGGSPIVVTTAAPSASQRSTPARPAPSPTPTATRSPTPRPRPTPAPTPSPSPTRCTNLPVLGCL